MSAARGDPLVVLPHSFLIARKSSWEVTRLCLRSPERSTGARSPWMGVRQNVNQIQCCGMHGCFDLQGSPGALPGALDRMPLK